MLAKVQARYSLFDEKYHFFQRFPQISVYGPKENRSYNYFQVAQAYSLGLGISVDAAKAVFAYAFALKEEDEDSDPSALSLIRRILGTTRGGHGPHAELVSSAEESLVEGPNETYYARRVREYRSRSVEKLRSTLLTTDSNSLRPTTFSELRIRILSAQAPASVTVHEPLLDLQLQQQLPLLHFLCLTGDLELVKHVVNGKEKAYAVKLVDKSGNTCLQYACMGGHTELVRYLVKEKEMEINKNNLDKMALLHWLVFFPTKDIPEIAQVLAHPDNLNVTSEGPRIPIHFLRLSGTPLQWATSCRNRDAVLTLINLGVDIDLEHNGYTALARAVELHLYEIVDLLLERGAKLSVNSAHQRSVMHYIAGNAPIIRRQAVHSSQHCPQAVMKTISALERHGCNINSCDRHNNTPLHKAVASPLERGNLYVVRALLLSGADRNIQNVDGNSVLHLAVKLTWVDRPNHKSLLQLLVDDEIAFLDTPLKTNLLDKNGRTPNQVGALLSATGDIAKIMPLTREDVLGQDNEGNHFMNLADKKVHEKLSYIHVFLKGLTEIGLVVGLEPDCS